MIGAQYRVENNMIDPGVYILQSLRDGRYYVGSTDNIDRRSEQHNKGLNSSIKRKRPLIPKAFIQCQSLKEARQSELRLKSYKSRKILEKVINDPIFPWNYMGG
jgi:putative endonuclease